MKGTFLERGPTEALCDYIVRLSLDPWFCGATDAELAEACKVDVEMVFEARRDHRWSAEVTGLFRDALWAKDHLGYAGPITDLLRDALRAHVKASRGAPKASKPEQATVAHVAMSLAAQGAPKISSGTMPREQHRGASGLQDPGGA